MLGARVMKTLCRLYYRVPFSETDAMGIVHHSNHSRYLERGRIEYLRLSGHDYTKMVERGLHFPVTELRIQYKKPLVFDDVILIETAVTEVSRTRLNFSYRVFSGVGELLMPSLSNEEFTEGAPAVLGESFHCCVNNKGRPVEIEAALLEEFKRLRAQ